MGAAFVEYLIMGFLFAVNVGLGKKKNTKEVKEGYIIKKEKRLKVIKYEHFKFKIRNFSKNPP